MLQALPDAARVLDRDHRAIVVGVERSAARLWRTMPAGAFSTTWPSRRARLLQQVTAAQLAAAQLADPYLDDVLADLDLDEAAVAGVRPEAFAGIASDGRPLVSLLDGPVARAVEVGGRAGMDAGEQLLRMLVQTQIADAVREAIGAGITARPAVSGYVRMLTPPSCPRCVILAGKYFRWNSGFRRHPRCDCIHIPSSEALAGDLRLDPRKAVEAGQVRGLSKASAKAIADGADPGQVVNAYRGMTTTTLGGRIAPTRVTSEGTTRRGYAYAVRRRLDEARGQATPMAATSSGQRGAIADYQVRKLTKPRLMPSEIYRVAGDDRAEAVRLLTANGYLTPRGDQTIRSLAATAL